jgi:hypothetical protein
MMLARIGRGVDIRCPKRAVAAGINFSFGIQAVSGRYRDARCASAFRW